jgi:hypothetical protein
LNCLSRHYFKNRDMLSLCGITCKVSLVLILVLMNHQCVRAGENHEDKIMMKIRYITKLTVPLSIYCQSHSGKTHFPWL